MNQDYINIIKFFGSDILNSKNMEKQKGFIQHGDVSVYEHSLRVAYLSIKIVSKFHLRVNMRSLIRGALLHDYFLYDWHIKDKSHRLHGFTHPKTAYKNAKKEFKVNDIEKDIIIKHMFPLVVVPPMYLESYIVTVADKISATKETFVHSNIKLEELCSL